MERNGCYVARAVRYFFHRSKKKLKIKKMFYNKTLDLCPKTTKNFCERRTTNSFMHNGRSFNNTDREALFTLPTHNNVIGEERKKRGW